MINLIKGVDLEYIRSEGNILNLYRYPYVYSIRSKNYSRRTWNNIWVIVIHRMALGKERDLRVLTGRDSEVKNVSSHYYIDRNGTVYNLVPEDMKAWHAGLSEWKGYPNVNNFSIGIELESRMPELDYTDDQYRSLLILVTNLAGRYRVELDDIVGHKDVAPGRKTDPENFDLNDLRYDVGRMLETIIA